MPLLESAGYQVVVQKSQFDLIFSFELPLMAASIEHSGEAASHQLPLTGGGDWSGEHHYMQPFSLFRASQDVLHDSLAHGSRI